MDSFEKQPSEEYSITVDFSEVLGDGETISTKVVTGYLNGVDVTSTIIGTSTISGETVIVRVKDGTENNYKITIVITTSADNTYEEDILMKVRSI